MTERERNIESICRDIAIEAENCSRTIDQIGVRIKKKPDWIDFVKDSPYWALGAAAGVGYLASRLFQSRTAPPEQIMGPVAEEVHDSPDGLHTGSTGFRLIKATLLGIVAKAAADWILNSASSAGTCCDDTEPLPKPGSDLNCNPGIDS